MTRADVLWEQEHRARIERDLARPIELTPERWEQIKNQLREQCGHTITERTAA